MSYCKLLNALIKINAIDKVGVIKEMLNMFSDSLKEKPLYVIYSLDGDPYLEAYFKRPRIRLSKSGLDIFNDGRVLGNLCRGVIRRILIGEGTRVVMMFKDENSRYVKLPTRPEFKVSLNPLIPMVISIVATLAIFIFLIRYGLWVTILATALQAPLISIAYTYIGLNNIAKININGSRLLRITIHIPRDSGNDALNRILMYASSIREIEPSEISELVSRLRLMAGNGNVYVDYLTIPNVKNAKIYMVPSPECNAISLNLFKGIIVLSNKLLACLSGSELESVILHELGHLANLDTYKSLVISAAYSSVMTIILFYTIFKTGLTPLSIAIYALSILVAILLVMMFSRFSEYRADEYAIRANMAPGLATSLVRITYPTIDASIIKQAFMSHPTTLRRIMRMVNLVSHGSRVKE